jgi:hypothetical protein
MYPNYVMEESDKKLGRYIAGRIKVESDPGDCPSELTLSRFMDGVLGEIEIEAISKHLLGCQKCSHSFSEALEIQEALLEEKAAEQHDEITIDQPMPGTKPESLVVADNPKLIEAATRFRLKSTGKKTIMGSLLAAAAVLVLVLLNQPDRSGFYQKTIASLTKDGQTEQLSRSIDIDPQQSFIFGFKNNLSMDQAAFRIGVLATGLEISLKAHDREKAILQLEPLIKLSRLTGQQSTIQNLEELLRQVNNGNFSFSVQEHILQLEKYFEKKETVFFMRFGSWVLAGKLAAVQQNEAFFALNEIDFYLQSIKGKQLAQRVGQLLKSIYRLSQAKEFEKYQFIALEKAFDGILEILM